MFVWIHDVRNAHIGGSHNDKNEAVAERDEASHGEERR